MITKGSIGQALTVLNLALDSNEGNISPSSPHEVSIHVENASVSEVRCVSFDRYWLSVAECRNDAECKWVHKNIEFIGVKLHRRDSSVFRYSSNTFTTLA